MSVQLLSSLVDAENSDQVKGIGRRRKIGEMSEKKTMAALKSHSEAEKRRRQRINSHLTTLRSLVPGTDKMDKATLLAAVVCQVKKLKKIAGEASKGLVIPMDIDEVTVEPLGHHEDGSYAFKATLCCDYRPGLLSDLRIALDALNLKVVRAEISNFGDRVKNEFVFIAEKGRKGYCSNADQAQDVLASSVHQALISILYRIYASPSYLTRMMTEPNKRRRLSFSDFTSSSM